MSFATKIAGAVGISLLAVGMQLPAQAQTTPAQTALNTETQPISVEADALTYPALEANSVELAQARRRTRNQQRGSDFIGIGADIGTTDDVTFAIISKFSLSNQLAIRPSALIGDDFAALVPVTYEFSRFTSNVDGFQIRPYVGVGVSYIDQDDNSELGGLVSAGADIPVSRRFTVNAQANYAGVFTDSESFGVTAGVGYNF